MDVYIRFLRSKLDEAFGVKLIHTAGRGLRHPGELSPVSPDSPPQKGRPAMPKRRRFQAPPDRDPLPRSPVLPSVPPEFRFFFRQLGIFLVMDLLLVIAGHHRPVPVGGKPLRRRGGSGGRQRSAHCGRHPRMEASDYSITPLDRGAPGRPSPLRLAADPPGTADALHQYDLMQYYSVELKSAGQPYAVTVDLTSVSGALCWAGAVLLICQGLSLLTNLFRNNRSIHKVLKPIQDLAATAARLNSMTHMSRQELEALVDELEKINAKHLDSRIDLPATQRSYALWPRPSTPCWTGSTRRTVPRCASSPTPATSCAPHRRHPGLRRPPGPLGQGRPGGPSGESIHAIRSEAKAMEELVEQLLFLARGTTTPSRSSLWPSTSPPW